MAIIIKEKKKRKKKTDPYYELVFNYMIGDANGDTAEEVILSADNPYIERFVTLLNRLKPTSGTWGIVFGSRNSTLEQFLHEKQITADEYLFLGQTMFDGWGPKNGDSLQYLSEDSKAYEWMGQFFEGIRGETEYSFLVFQGCDLYYYDEYGQKHETEFK